MYSLSRSLGEVTAAGVVNAVTGQVHPLDTVAYAGPNPHAPTTETMLQLTNGYTWTWAGQWTDPVIGTPDMPAALTAAYANADAAALAAAQAARVLDYRSYDRVIRPSLRADGTWVQIAQREHHHFTDGTEQLDAWTIYNAGTSYPLEQWQAWKAEGRANPYPTELLLLRPNMSDAEWAAIEADFAASGIAPQVLVPYVPGSQVFVPAPGTGGEPTIQLPGATAPVPVSSLTPQQIATETAAQGSQYVPASSSVPTGSPQLAPSAQLPPPGSQPGSYAVPGGGYASPGASPTVTQGSDAIEPVLQGAGIGSGLLIGGGILVAVLLLSSRKGRRVKGYRRF